MTVIRSNYHEVYDFIELGRSVGATSVLFQMIFETRHDQNYLFPRTTDSCRCRAPGFVELPAGDRP